jgi:hypothetical protein
MTYLITLQDIYSGTTIQKNVESFLLNPFIERAQVDFVEKLLGTACYNDLIAQVDSVGLTGLTGSYLTLKENIKPMLVLYTWYYATPFLAVKFDNKGVNQLVSDNSANVGESRQTDLINRILNLAQEAELKCLKFLRTNYIDYPLWRENIYYDDSKGNDANTLFGGIEFDSTWKDDYVYINGKRYRRGDLL